MNDDKQRTTVTMLVPHDLGERTSELAVQMGRMLRDSEAEFGDCAMAALCVASAFWATSGTDSAKLANNLSKVIRRLVDANREG
jgi:hypothetical protein